MMDEMRRNYRYVLQGVSVLFVGIRLLYNYQVQVYITCLSDLVFTTCVYRVNTRLNHVSIAALLLPPKKQNTHTYINCRIWNTLKIIVNI